MTDMELTPLLVIGRGGWHAQIPNTWNRDPYSHPTRVSGYGTTLATALEDWTRDDNSGFTADAVIVDLTAMTDDNIYRFAVSGPMVNPYLPDNTVDSLSGREEWNGGTGELRGTSGALLATDERGITAIMTSGDTVAAVEALSKQPAGSIFGNAGSLSHVSRDVYVALARAFGAVVYRRDDSGAWIVS